jgi:hypothetical protein
MVQRIFKVAQDSSAATGWSITDTYTGTVLELPEVVFEELDKGKYVDADEMLGKIETVQIALAGVTDSLRMVDEYSFRHRSVMKTFGLKKQGNSIDDSIDFFLESVTDYEKYHTIEMGRDKPGDDTSIHAYIETPKDGKLRCTFDKSVRLNAKRNNIKYWVEDYKLSEGSNGGKFIRPIGDPVEIM